MNAAPILKAAVAGFLAAGMVAVVPGAAAAAGSVEWDNKRGLDASSACAADQSPFLHWVLTPGGKDRFEESGTTLTVDGRTVPAQREGSGEGALHFYTDYTDPTTIDSAVATTSGTPGRNAHLTISSGCFRTEETGPQGCTAPMSASSDGRGGMIRQYWHAGSGSGTIHFLARAYESADTFRIHFVNGGRGGLNETIGLDATPSGAAPADPVSEKRYTLPFQDTDGWLGITVSSYHTPSDWDYTIYACPNA